MTDDKTRIQYRAIVDGIIEIGREVGGISEEYLREFAAASAWHVLAALERDHAIGGAKAAWDELEAQALLVAETIQELGEQAARRALVRTVITATRFAVSVAKAA